jgi:hypothetical protein
MKIITLVLSAETDKYSRLEDGIRKTWLKRASGLFEVYFYYGGYDRFSVEGDRILCDSPEGLYNIGYKTLSAYRYLLENKEFDFIFRTNSSSFIRPDKLVEFLNTKPKSKLYCGRVNVQSETGIVFASGSGYFMSRDIVKSIVENEDKWNHELIDDVALGVLLKNIGVNPSQSIRFDINRIEGNRLFIGDREVDRLQFGDHFHFRCKTSDRDRNDDVRIMQELNRIFPI